MVGIEQLTEPIPGYRLLERLGKGGFGEVWKAQAPGGLFKAVKIVYGSLGAPNQEEDCVRQELKALERVKQVRHPFILSLERYDIVARRLIIVTELADRSVWDRFQECRAQGWAGIPRDELLRYLEETAEALDLMNQEHQLQHLDIKPQNLFLLYNHIKVGDFGLVKDLAGRRAQATSGFTVTYASPEMFQGVVSRFCDQYSLAIVYQELLTGQLPFVGSNHQQMMLHHLSSTPDLAPLPREDRGPIGRALSKRPEDRHPSCGDFVRTFRRGGGHGPAVDEPSRRHSTSRRGTPPRDERTTTILNKSTVSPSAAAPERAEVTGDGTLFPAVVVGLGGLGLPVLRQLRKVLHQRYGYAATFPNIRLLQLDADPEGLREAPEGGTDAVLREREVLLARLQRPTHYLKPGREHDALASWFPLTMLSRLPRDQVTPCGWRPLGRLAFVTNSRMIEDRLRAELEACTDQEAMAEADRQTGLGLRSSRPRVYIVTSLSGGTGGGMFIDLARAARHLLQQLGHPGSQVIGLFLLPAGGRGAAPSRAVANACAALTELNHVAAQGAASGAGGQRGEVASNPGPPFSRCIVLPLPKESDGAAPLRQLTTLVGDYLCWDLTAPLGRAADKCRAEILDQQPGLSYQTFGAFWFSVPRRPLLQRVAAYLGNRLVSTWRADDQLDDSIRAWVEQELTHSNLSVDRLVERLQAACAQALGQAPEELCPNALKEQIPGGAAELSRKPAAAIAALAEVERVVGCPKDAQPGAPAPPLEQAVAEAAAGVLKPQFSEQLAGVALNALSAPQYRLTGADAKVRDRLIDAFLAGARSQKALAEERKREAAQLRNQLVSVHTKLAQSSRWWGNRSKSAADLLETLARYARVAGDAVVFAGVGSLYDDLVAELPKYLRSVTCCHGRIFEFLRHFAGPGARGKVQADLGLGRYLLPGSCRTLDEAAEHILATLTPDELLGLNQNVQALIGKKLREQVHVCTAPPAFFKELHEEVYHRVATFAEAQLTKAHAAEVYLAQRPDDARMLNELAGAFDEATPELAGSPGSTSGEFCVLAVPPGAEGEYFRGVAGRALPGQAMVAAASTHDIVFYREQANVPAAALGPLSPAGQEAYRHFLTSDSFTPHSRADIVYRSPVKGP